MTNPTDNQNRRTFIANSGLLALAATPGLAGAGAHEKNEHEHHGGQYAALIKESLHCIETGNACGAHCIDDIRKGNTELIECLVQVQDLVNACQGLVQMAAYDSEHLKTYAAAIIDVCNTCETECRKFADIHEVCKNCSDACAACAEEAKKIT